MRRLVGCGLINAMGRIPTVQDVAALSREEWEDLCRCLVALKHQAEGIEDHFGKGNGLDMIRIDPEGAWGWQFRRFDKGFEAKQASGVRESVRLAASRCQQEEGVKLVKYSLWANVDLAPGHRGSIGDRQRVSELKRAVKDEHDVEFEFVGITQVRAELLPRPLVRPDLFEDVNAQLAEIKQQLVEQGSELRRVRELQAAAAKTPGVPDAAKRLIEQAVVHYERGRKHGTNEEFEAASRCFEDAANLLSGLDIDPALEGRIRVAQAATANLSGKLAQVETYARRALELLPEGEGEARAHASSAIALLRATQRRFAEGEPLLREALRYFELAGNAVEVMRILTHLTEFELNRGELAQAQRWASRLRRSVVDVEDMIGVSDLSMAGAGAIFRVLLEEGLFEGSPTKITEAERNFAQIEHTAREIQSPHLVVACLLSRAAAARGLNKLGTAATLLEIARLEADNASMAKDAADALYTLGGVERQRGRVAEALEAMLAAKRRYEAIGDDTSVKDAVDRVAEWSR